MATNFFEQQENARRKTVWLVVYFLLSIAFIIGALFLLVEFLLANSGNPLAAAEHLGLLGGVSAGVVGVVGTGSLLKTAQLASGGSAVARMMGGTLVNSSTSLAHEKVLLNVVEEMAIASGVPVPVVYVLEHEPGINAFAAGYTTGDACIAVSRGCLEMLTRDELQGVVAHEFSHILNGDMRLNIRLIGLVFGLVGLAQIGYMVFRFVSESRQAGPSAYGPSSADDDKKSGSSQGVWLVLLLSGLAIYLLGLLGQLCGRLIQAAISRQREFLADASAVQ
ncbi:MAG: M48 family metalloprotease, partial [Gemmataceae bacterium]